MFLPDELDSSWNLKLELDNPGASESGYEGNINSCIESFIQKHDAHM